MQEVAKITLSEALSVARSIEDAYRRDTALVAIAQAQVDAVSR